MSSREDRSYSSTIGWWASTAITGWRHREYGHPESLYEGEETLGVEARHGHHGRPESQRHRQRDHKTHDMEEWGHGQRGVAFTHAQPATDLTHGRGRLEVSITPWAAQGAARVRQQRHRNPAPAPPGVPAHRSRSISISAWRLRPPEHDDLTHPPQKQPRERSRASAGTVTSTDAPESASCTSSSRRVEAGVYPGDRASAAIAPSATPAHCGRFGAHTANTSPSPKPARQAPPPHAPFSTPACHTTPHTPRPVDQAGLSTQPPSRLGDHPMQRRVPNLDRLAAARPQHLPLLSAVLHVSKPWVYNSRKFDTCQGSRGYFLTISEIETRSRILEAAWGLVGERRTDGRGDGRGGRCSGGGFEAAWSTSTWRTGPG